MKHLSKKRVIVLGAVTSLALGAVAFAFFTSTGTGSGSATTGTSVAFTVTTDAALGDPLTPAGPTQTVAYHVTNPGSGNQNVAHTNISVANVDGTAWSSGTCDKDDFSLNGAAAGSTVDDADANGNLAAGDTADGSVSIQLVDTGDNQDDCKNVTVPLYLSVS